MVKVAFLQWPHDTSPDPRLPLDSGSEGQPQLRIHLSTPGDTLECRLVAKGAFLSFLSPIRTVTGKLDKWFRS